MTSEQFQRDYQVLDRVTEGAVETYHAQATSGAMVMVHYLRGSAEDNAEIYGLIERLDAERKRKVLISADVDGVPAIITRFILDFRSLREWLGAPSPAVPSESATAKAPPPRSTAGEFTMLFGSPADAEKAPPPAAGAPAPTAPPPPKSEPGEFTRMFASGSAGPAAVSPPPGEPPPPAAPPPPAKEPGEFTQLFGRAEPQAGTPPPPAVQPAPPPPPPARGEFTAMFGASPQPAGEAPRAPEPPPAEFSPPIPAAPPPAQLKGPGEFTKMFGTPVKAADPPLTPPSAPPPPLFAAQRPLDELSFGTPPVSAPPTGGSYTRMFGTPGLPPDLQEPLFPNQPAPPDAGGGNDEYFERLTRGGAPAPAPAPVPNAPPPPIYSGQSEFTRVVSALPAPPVASPPPPPIPPAPAPARSNRIVLFGLVGVILTAIIFVVLLIAIR